MSIEPDYIVAHQFSIRHRPQVEASHVCGCFYCKTVTPEEISDWLDDSAPAGFPLTADFLAAMNCHWF